MNIVLSGFAIQRKSDEKFYLKKEYDGNHFSDTSAHVFPTKGGAATKIREGLPGDEDFVIVEFRLLPMRAWGPRGEEL